MSQDHLGPEEYLLYEIINQSDLKGTDVHKTEIHKLAYLVYKDLEGDSIEGQELALPSYWYEHGIMIDFEEVVTHFLKFESKRYDSTRGNVGYLTPDVSKGDFDVVPELAEKIKRKTASYIDEFGHTFGVKAVKDETYNRFGNEFVQELNGFRYKLNDAKDYDVVDKDEYAPTDVSFSDIVDTEQTTDVDFDEVEDQQLLNSLNFMIKTFPEEEYNRMAEEFYEWESITRQLIYNNMYSQLENFTDDFWNTFSRVVLRVKHNDNIPQTKIVRWKRDRSDALDGFGEEVERYRRVLLDNRNDTTVLDSVGEEFDSAVTKTFKEYRNETH